MKALTIWQPWASLIALGVKTIETRSWRTDYRGPLAIHAAKTPDTIPPKIGPYARGRWADPLVHADSCDCDLDEERAGDRCLGRSDWSWALMNDEGAHGWSLVSTLPLGAVVATCQLVDCVRMVWLPPKADRAPGVPSHTRHTDGRSLLEITSRHELILCDGATGRHRDDQMSYGDFRPGRWAWLLDDIVPLEQPVAARGRQQLWDWNPDAEVPT